MIKASMVEAIEERNTWPKGMIKASLGPLTAKIHYKKVQSISITPPSPLPQNKYHSPSKYLQTYIYC